MLIDEVTIKVKAGHGGAGRVAFNRNKMAYGPTGGDGGRGGSVFAEGVADIAALKQFTFKKEGVARDGRIGGVARDEGKSGEDLVLKLPIGTKITNHESGDVSELLKIGERVKLAEGGKGGHGNFYFRSSKNTSPKHAQTGLPGEEFIFTFELQLIADVGLIGLPNAGKSSLLNALTRAGAKVGNYKFTTLEPNLGAYYDLILADIPGLIEGASAGKGLGVKFLRHIRRTNILFHLVSSESEDPEGDYKTIHKELGAYDPALLQKTEYVFLSKADMVDAKTAQQKLEVLRRLNPRAALLSIELPELVAEVRHILADIAGQKRVA